MSMFDRALHFIKMREPNDPARIETIQTVYAKWLDPAYFANADDLEEMRSYFEDGMFFIEAEELAAVLAARKLPWMDHLELQQRRFMRAGAV